MAKETTDTQVTAPPFSRFILWEILGVVGFLHILQYAPANDVTPLYFLANAVVFVIVYPILYFYNQMNIPQVLRVLISPLSVVLRLVLMVSCYFWIAYILYATGCTLGFASCYAVFRDDFMYLAPFFVMDYLFFMEHLWGVGRVNVSFWRGVGMISDAVSGVVGGYYLGRTLNTKWGVFFGDDETRALIWVLFILIGIAAVVWFSNKTRQG